MPKKAQKAELASLQRQFIRDLAKLRKEYDNSELAQRAGIDPANLSSYGSGSKKPGIKVLTQFYLAFPDELQNPLEKINNMENAKDDKQKQGPDYNHNDPATDNKTNEAALYELYRNKESAYEKEIISLLKAENAHLRLASIKMLDGSDRIFQLPFRWLESIDKSNQITLTMTEAHKMMIVAFLQKFAGEEKPN